jgi:hypothetical protein
MKIVVATLGVLTLPLVVWLMLPTVLCLAVTVPFTLPLAFLVLMAARSERQVPATAHKVSATAPSHPLPEPARPLLASRCLPLVTVSLDGLALATCSGGAAPQAGRDVRAIDLLAARDARSVKPTVSTRPRGRTPAFGVALDGF